MKNIFRRFMASFLLVPGIVTPLLVVACTNDLFDLEDDVESLNLGDLENLKSSTILEAFSKKNPLVRMEFIDEYVEGNTKSAIIRTGPPNFYYKSSQVTVTYHSKLEFNYDEISDEIKEKDDKCMIDINISDSYDEKVDGKITFADGNFFDLLNYDYEIDKVNRIYKIIISLKEKVTKPLQKNDSILLWWDQGDENNRKPNITVTELKLKISLV